MTVSSDDQDFAFTSIGVDIGKDVFHLVAFDLDGKVVLRREIKRLAPIFGQTLRRVLDKRANARVVVPTVAAKAEMMASAADTKNVGA